MVFKGVEPSVAISTKDINSYIFDAPAYDVNKPVSMCDGNEAWFNLTKISLRSS